MADHAACSPSSAPTWMNCPASITKAEGRTRPSSQYAKEGTAAHSIAEMILGGNLLPPGKIEIEGSTFIVGMPMLKALRPYIDFVQGLQDIAEEVKLEARVYVSWSSGLVWGTTDCAAKIGDTLHIVDLKYGKGVEVTPDSAQLKIYALAAISTFWADDRFEEVRMTVIQPRMNPQPVTNTMSMRDLLGWARDDFDPALKRIVDDDKTEKAGAWCRWCVRKGECAAFAQRRATAVAEIFDDGIDI